MISAQEWEVLSFFSVEPTLLDANIPWCYNTATYVAWVGELTIRCTIAPGGHDIDFNIQQNGMLILEMSLYGAKDIQYNQEANVETLIVVMTDEITLELVLQPRLSLRQTMGASLCSVCWMVGES